MNKEWKEMKETKGSIINLIYGSFLKSILYKNDETISYKNKKKFLVKVFLVKNKCKKN
jgi:hypothetical protein